MPRQESCQAKNLLWQDARERGSALLDQEFTLKKLLEFAGLEPASTHFQPDDGCSRPPGLGFSAQRDGLPGLLGGLGNEKPLFANFG